MKPLRVLRWCAIPVALAGLSALGWHFLSSGRSTKAPADPPWFVDVTEKTGLRFNHDAGRFADYDMPLIMGSGAAAFDFDGDGRLDVYLLNNGGATGRPNQLFQQQRDGTFKDVGQGSGLDFAGHCMGVAIADVNNDGRPDVLVTEHRGVRLFLNRGGGKFVDVTREAGLKNPGWATSAAFFDYNRDGWLDLVVVNYVDYNTPGPCGTPAGPDFCPPRAFKGQVTRLFRNLGRASPRGGDGVDLVTFQDVTEASGLGKRPGPGLGVVCADFNGDGWPDIFVANDGEPNHLWINRQNGTFTEEAVVRGLAYNVMGQSEAGMGVALGDVDGNGLFDVFVTHLAEETNTLWVQGPPGLFRDRTAAHGLARPLWRGTGFGTVLADFDHDGALDLAVVNGRVGRSPDIPTRDLPFFWRRYAERNQLFANDGSGRFRDVSDQNAPFCGGHNVARGLVWGDLSGKGAVDLLVTTVAGPARLYRNVAPRRGHWLLVRALDPTLRRDAIGAVVRVKAGQKSWVRQINPASSYLCSGDVRAHFGLGSADRDLVVEVVWPDGAQETFAVDKADREVVLEKGKGDRPVADKREADRGKPGEQRR
jgi:enediyne biosynthesis protein E4